MSYEQLADHAAKLETSAIEMDLKQRGFQKNHGKWSGGSGITDEYMQDIYDITAGRFGGVAEMFAPFLGMPDPGGFVPAIAALTNAASTLNSGTAPDVVNSTSVSVNVDLGGMDRVGTLVADWRGPAATGFRNNYLDRFKGVTANQYAMALTLKGALEAERGLWKAARESVDQLAHAAQVSLDSMLDCNPKETACLLTVVGSIFAVAAAVPSAGASLAVTLTVVGEVASSAASVPVEDPKPVRFSGENANAIVEQIRKGLEELAKDINDKERVIADALASSHAVLTGSRDRFMSNRPALADATAATVTGNGPTGLGTAEG
ncbi:hypothetical protein ACFQFC_10860 [Amorphoplanes digitatis]|uniref:ESX-1 secretion-associated protein EspA/EspE-like domain-containing protein n=1 Tax=Actinoplanes digitatis TaxID=1868 RepID=A0A7W7I1D9_9ACTN|nr:hypothetical protein [Actinoplanes digitatis]MBB4764698.1 hypothetical protein [Actinoplanes digitatis]BFE74246.1 hypothetical protein GCM10020092_075470 [Actinoplanes digitatis]GID91350.1 hypothetical protein Adi01nite_07620 [Actinoplanes digitatis]